jgi:hypothetical protein
MGLCFSRKQDVQELTAQQSNSSSIKPIRQEKNVKQKLRVDVAEGIENEIQTFIEPDSNRTPNSNITHHPLMYTPKSKANGIKVSQKTPLDPPVITVVSPASTNKSIHVESNEPRVSDDGSEWSEGEEGNNDIKKRSMYTSNQNKLLINAESEWIAEKPVLPGTSNKCFPVTLSGCNVGIDDDSVEESDNNLTGKYIILNNLTSNHCLYYYTLQE